MAEEKMAEEKKVELNEESLDSVAGGNNVKKSIAVAAAVIAGSIVGYKTYHTTMNALDESDGTSKGGNKNNGGGKIKSDNINITVGKEQQAINVGRGNSVGGQVNISFGKK